MPLLLALAACGCCSVPPPERYFNRVRSFDTLNGFAYAVDTGQYRFAYGCLNPRSQEMITFSRFRLALKFRLEVPKLKIPLRDLIVDSERDPERVEHLGERHAVFRVLYTAPGGRDQYEVPIHLDRESDAEARTAERRPFWRIDLERTGQDLRRVIEVP